MGTCNWPGTSRWQLAHPTEPSTHAPPDRGQPGRSGSGPLSRAANARHSPRETGITDARYGPLRPRGESVIAGQKGFLGGAGDENRTRMTSLEGWGSAIELHPHTGLMAEWAQPTRCRREACALPSAAIPSTSKRCPAKNWLRTDLCVRSQPVVVRFPPVLRASPGHPGDPPAASTGGSGPGCRVRSTAPECRPRSRSRW